MSKPLFERFVEHEVSEFVIRVHGARTAAGYDPPQLKIEAGFVQERDERVLDELQLVIESHSRAMFEHTRDEIQTRIRDLVREQPAMFNGSGEEQVEGILRNLDFATIVRNSLKP